MSPSDVQKSTRTGNRLKLQPAVVANSIVPGVPNEQSAGTVACANLTGIGSHADRPVEMGWPGATAAGEAAMVITGVRALPTIGGMWRPRTPRVGNEYVTGSFRDGILMIVVILAAIVVIGLAYGWALGVPGVPAAP